VPELPEVEVVRRGLLAFTVGRRIARVEVRHDRAVRRQPGGAGPFVAAVADRTVLDIRRRGKYLWWVLDSGDALVAHLGMSGQFRITGGPAPAADPPAAQFAQDPADHPHLRIRFTFGDGGPAVDFQDQRTFGGMQFVPGGAELPGPLAHIGRDPLDPQFDPDRAVATVRSRRSDIKRVLLDQTVVSGIGNIYADEALWAARLHYARPADRLTRPAVRRLLDAATAVMAEALDAGGTSFDSLYVNVNGESGYFDRSLHAYGRGGRPCDRCGTAIRRDAFMNRSSFFCPRCQPRPRSRPSD